jgi:hypothetical protein
MSTVIRAVVAALIAVGAAAAGGCSGREFAEVEGQVTLDGKPLTDVEIVFMPDSTKGNKGNSASAYPDADGRYRLQTPRDNRAGTVLGPHRVVVIDLSAIAPLGGGAPPAPGGANAPATRSGAKSRRFPQKYGDVADTPFKDVEIKSGKQTLDFDLKAKG